MWLKGVLECSKWSGVFLREIPSYATHNQSQIIVAWCALHNFIRTSGIQDRHFARCDNDENFVPQEAYEDQPEAEVVPDESELMNAFRDSMALAMVSRAWQFCFVLAHVFVILQFWFEWLNVDRYIDDYRWFVDVNVWGQKLFQ